MSFKRIENGTTFKRARAHRSYSLEERPTPQPPPKILVKRKATPEKPPEVVTPKPKPKPEPKPEPVIVYEDLTVDELYDLAKERGLKATRRHKKAELIALFK